VIDLHLHLLPGVDDGPETVAEAVEMCRMAAADGTTAVVTTPHQLHPLWLNEDIELLQTACDELRKAVDAPEIHLGAEIRITSNLLDLLPEIPTASSGPRDRTHNNSDPTRAPQFKIKNSTFKIASEASPVSQFNIQNSTLKIERLIPLAGSNALLLEFFSTDTGLNPREIIHELVVAGLRPILAHPERIPWLTEDLGRLAELVDLGAEVQLTGGSITGRFGSRIRRICKDLLDLDLVHFVASDAHNTTTRPPGLSEAYAAVARGWGHDVAHLLFIENPNTIIARHDEAHSASNAEF